MRIQKHNIVQEAGVPESIILEYNKVASPSDLFAVVRVKGTDDDIVAHITIEQVATQSDDPCIVSTYRLTLPGTIPPGRYVYDVFRYEGDSPTSKLLWGYLLVRESVSDRGRE